MTRQLPIRAQINHTILELHQGDITQQDTDAIVNAANSTLLGGGGVDGAIHRAAGPELLAETRTLNGCETGDAKISKGYRLKAKHVIHAVGPIYQPNNPDSPRLLASAYRRSLEIATQNGLHSLAFPAISTGVYGYPLAAAAPLALQTVYDYISNQTQITLVRFVLFTREAVEVFAAALDELVKQHKELSYL